MDGEVSQPNNQAQKPMTQPQESKKPETPKGPGVFSKFKSKLLNYRRVLEVSHKPDKDELIRTTKVVVVGVALIGAIGFVISLIYILGVQGVA